MTYPRGTGSALRLAIMAMVLTLGLAPPVRAAQGPTHPLDALTASEIDRAVAILRDAKRVTDATRFPTITLLENPKSAVLAWRPGQKFDRRARVTFLEGGR